MAITNEELLIAIKADTTNLMSGLKTAGKGITDFKQTIAGVGKKMTVTGALITAGVVKTFKDFTEYESRLTDMAKVTNQSYEEIEDSIKGIDPVLGNSTELMEGYYQTISAGVKDPIEALNTLTVAAEAGKASHTDQAEVVKGLTKMMAGYEGKIEDVSTAADLLFSIEKEGQTTVGELIPIIGGLAKMSFDLGVGQEEMAASMAVVTKTAGSTAEATTQYQGILSGLMKPTESMIDAFKEIGENIRGVGEGYKSAEEMIKDLGFVDAMKNLKKYSEESGTSIAKLFGRKEAMIGFSALGAKGFRTLNETIVSVGEGAGGAKRAFEEWSETGEATMTDLKNTFTNFSTDVGRQLAPMIKDLLEGITDIISKVSEWAKANPELFESITKLGVVIGGICIVGGPLLLAISAFSGIATAIAAIGTIATGPIGLLIAAVGLAYLAFKNWDKIVAFFKDLVGKIKDIFGGFIKSMLEWGKNAIGGFIKGIKSKIAGLTDTIKGIGTKIKNLLGFKSPPIEGPLSDSDTWMPNMMKMFGWGIANNIDKIIEPIEEIANSMSNAIQDIKSKYAPEIAELTELINDLFGIGGSFGVSAYYASLRERYQSELAKLKHDMKNEIKELNSIMAGHEGGWGGVTESRGSGGGNLPSTDRSSGGASYGPAFSPTIHINNPVVRNDDDIPKIRREVQNVLDEMRRQYNRTGNELIPGVS